MWKLQKMADQGNEGLLSPFLRRERFKAAMPYLHGRILDVGSGSGALAEIVNERFYLGVEVDEISLIRARKDYPLHRFINTFPKVTEKFDTVVSLAVIEHVPDPVDFFKTLAQFLVISPKARIVITTPHPSVDWIHNMGGNLGIFSKHAHEEHQDLLDKVKISTAGECAGLVMVHYKRFLFGANQLAIFKVRLLR